MSTRVLTAELWLPKALSSVFPFFADAGNLQRITPEWVNFRVLTPLPIEMREGALIDYRIKVRGVPLGWRTRITGWDPPRRFEDVQVRGPYVKWEHEHTFEEVDGGTMCRDRVRYRSPLGWILHPLVVDRDVRRIFEYRQARLAEVFGVKAERVAVRIESEGAAVIAGKSGVGMASGAG
jgi:ligand-binding SRPBCC domain-containing protein